MVDLIKSAPWNKMKTLTACQTRNRGWSKPPREIRRVTQKNVTTC